MIRAVQTDVGGELAIEPDSVERPKKLTAAQRGKLAAEYVAGATVSELAARFAVHRTTVLRTLELLGVERRRGKLTGQDVDEIVRRYEAGETTIEIGRSMGIAKSTVRARLIERHVARRPGGR